MIVFCHYIQFYMYYILWLGVEVNQKHALFRFSVSVDDSLHVWFGVVSGFWFDSKACFKHLFSLLSLKISLHKVFISSFLLLNLFISTSNELIPNIDFGVSLKEVKFISHFWPPLFGIIQARLLKSFKIDEWKDISYSFIEFHFQLDF